MEKVWTVTFYDKTDDSHDIYTVCKSEISAIKAVMRDIAEVADENYIPFGIAEISTVMTEINNFGCVDLRDINMAFPDYAYYVEQYSVED